MSENPNRTSLSTDTNLDLFFGFKNLYKKRKPSAKIKQTELQTFYRALFMVTDRILFVINMEEYRALKIKINHENNIQKVVCSFGVFKKLGILATTELFSVSVVLPIPERHKDSYGV